MWFLAMKQLKRILTVMLMRQTILQKWKAPPFIDYDDCLMVISEIMETKIIYMTEKQKFIIDFYNTAISFVKVYTLWGG
ncbi:hypothetical protein [Paenibacillus sp. Leaf72]|uniref:hypothetical protein n=1 Tax=Paenibacillus sp. Leaf72 TaxID=1736234 RepID=UPI0006FC487A|nr:hypothetical protein [Paenibacillus sp. Leaf72]KQO17477.1 hypothetical protein ASF12_01965 [Paenibacillus sp. Leaf72]